MGIQIKGQNDNITSTDGSLEITGITTFNTQLDIGTVVKLGSAGIVTASNFKTGISNLHDVGLTLTGGQLDVGSHIKIGNAGVVTATSFVGSGANLTSLPAQVTLSNNADNRVITGGSGVNLNGESGLTYNGQALNVNSVTSENNAFRVYNTSTSATTFQINGEGNSFQGHTYPRSDANLDLGYHSGYRWRDVVLSGGIRFGSANSNDYLDDYEEGSWTPTEVSGLSLTVYVATYIKIGRLVHVECGFLIPTNSDGGSIQFGGLPYQAQSSGDNSGGLHLTSTNSGRSDHMFAIRNSTNIGLSNNNNQNVARSAYSNKQLKFSGTYMSTS